jgi:hypothetical protein
MAEENDVGGTRRVEFVEDRVPLEGIAESIEDLVEIYGGRVTNSSAAQRSFEIPLRRGVATSGAIACVMTWVRDESGDGTVTMVCDREIDAPRYQRILLLAAGVLGSIAFMLWPFFPNIKEFGTIAWLGGAVALAVYFLSLRKTSGGVAYDFLRRVANRQRASQE